MFYTLKELALVLFFGYWTFRVSRKIQVLFPSDADFRLRRNTWFILTIVGFLAPNFLFFLIVAIPVLVAAGRRDSNPSALYLLLLHVVPPVAVIQIPMIGISYLFEVDFYFVLSSCLLLPLARKIRNGELPEMNRRKLDATEYLLLAYGILTSILYVQVQSPTGDFYPTTATDSLRRVFVFFFATLLPYYAISRSGTTKKSTADLLAMYAMGCALMASVAIFEGFRHWLLYAEFGPRWNAGFNSSTYIGRGDSLRAMASSGHPLALGFLLAVGFGCWLYFETRVKSKLTRIFVTVFWCFGLLASFSRGPWLGALLIFVLFTVMRPEGVKYLVRSMGFFLIAVLVVSLTPLSNKITSVLPFLGGTVDTYNVTYRQRLFERCWEIIQDNWMFGDQHALSRMQDLRQGEGIIDIINAYVQVLLDNGFVGLSLFLGVIFVAAGRAYMVSRRSRSRDPDLSLLGAAIVACVMGVLVMLAGGNMGTGPGRTFYAFAAIAAGYGYLGRSIPNSESKRSIG